jgi:Zn-dependent protease with chaperone function
VVVGLAVAVTRALFQGQWMVGGVLAFVGLAAVFCPLADAAISRRSEFAADRFAADHGLARELAAALHAMDGGWSVAAGWSRRLLASIRPPSSASVCSSRRPGPLSPVRDYGPEPAS